MSLSRAGFFQLAVVTPPALVAAVRAGISLGSAERDGNFIEEDPRVSAHNDIVEFERVHGREVITQRLIEEQAVLVERLAEATYSSYFPYEVDLEAVELVDDEIFESKAREVGIDNPDLGFTVRPTLRTSRVYLRRGYFRRPSEDTGALTTARYLQEHEILHAKTATGLRVKIGENEFVLHGLKMTEYRPQGRRVVWRDLNEAAVIFLTRHMDLAKPEDKDNEIVVTTSEINFVKMEALWGFCQLAGVTIEQFARIYFSSNWTLLPNALDTGLELPSGRSVNPLNDINSGRLDLFMQKIDLIMREKKRR